MLCNLSYLSNEKWGKYLLLLWHQYLAQYRTKVGQSIHSSIILNLRYLSDQNYEKISASIEAPKFGIHVVFFIRNKVKSELVQQKKGRLKMPY